MLLNVNINNGTGIIDILALEVNLEKLRSNYDNKTSNLFVVGIVNDPLITSLKIQEIQIVK